MLRRISKIVRGVWEQVESSRLRAGAVIESLEGRCLLSVSAQVLAGPVQIPGNTWRYELDSGNTTLGFETLTSKGTVTHNGLPAIEVDIAFSKKDGTAAGSQVNFYAFTTDGFVLQETTATGFNGTVSDTVNSPAQWVLPQSLSAGAAVTSPASTETETVTPSGGSPTTSTDTVTVVTTLVSETPSVPVQAAGKTFTCYQVNTTQTTLTEGSLPDVSSSQAFIDPNIGMVQLSELKTGNVLKLTNFTGTSFHLAVTQQPPTNILAKDKIDPGVRIELQDPSGATDTNPADAVTITASIAPGGTGTGTLSGSSVTTSGGVANFSDLSIDKPGTYTLNFTDSIGRSVPTNSFQVSAGRLRFVKHIKNHIAGSALHPVVEVELVDRENKRIKDAPSTVTLNIDGTNAISPTITGNTAELVDGMAVFNAVKLGIPGDYTLNATDAQGDIKAVSNSFEITGVHLVIHKLHGKAGVDAPLRYTVRLEDSKERVVKISSVGLGLTLNVIDGDPNAAIDHPADTFDDGIANNSDSQQPASINRAGTYSITFAVISESSDAFDYAITPITSVPIKILANHLDFAKQPHSTAVGIPLRYKLEMKDYRGHIVTDNIDQLMFSLQPSSISTVLASGVDQLTEGIATNAGKLLSINTPGSYKLTVVDVPTDPGDPAAKSTISDSFKIKAT